MRRAERLRDLFFVQVKRRRDDVARRLLPKLDDVFAEIGLDRHDAVRFEKRIEPDLLGDHGFALGHGLRARLAQNAKDDLARLTASRAQCTCPPRAVTLRSNFSSSVSRLASARIADRLARFAQRFEIADSARPLPRA